MLVIGFGLKTKFSGLGLGFETLILAFNVLALT